MKPILFTIPWVDLPLYGYGVMLGLSFLAGWFLTGYIARWYGLDESKVYPAMSVGILASLIFARLFHVFSNPEHHWTLMRILDISKGGLVAYGGFIGGTLTVLTYWKIKHLNIWAYLDAFIPGLSLGLCLTRIGCLLRGCCYGIRSDSFLAISFPEKSLVVQQHTRRGWLLLDNGWSTPVLPTQLFESMAGFVLMGVSLWLLYLARKERSRPDAGERPLIRDGYVLWFFVIGYSVFRFFIEFIRDDGGRGTVGPLSTSQFIALPLIALALFFMIYWIPRHPFKAPAPEEKAPRAIRRKQTKTGKKAKKRRKK